MFLHPIYLRRLSLWNSLHIKTRDGSCNLECGFGSESKLRVTWLFFTSISHNEQRQIRWAKRNRNCDKDSQAVNTTMFISLSLPLPMNYYNKSNSCSIRPGACKKGERVKVKVKF
jgi:hypothetical protein